MTTVIFTKYKTNQNKYVNNNSRNGTKCLYE